MYLKKFLAQPNIVGSVLIALLICGVFVYAFAFDGFNIETATGGEVEAWLAVGDNYGKDCDNDGCVQSWAGCPGNGCTDCEKQDSNCSSNCKHGHQGCGNTGNCPFNSSGGTGYCSEGGSTCPSNCNKK